MKVKYLKKNKLVAGFLGLLFLVGSTGVGVLSLQHAQTVTPRAASDSQCKGNDGTYKCKGNEYCDKGVCKTTDKKSEDDKTDCKKNCAVADQQGSCTLSNGQAGYKCRYSALNPNPTQKPITKITTEITKKPPQFTNETSATFEFTGTDGKGSSKNLIFRCSVDGKPWEDNCTSPKTYSDLKAVDHYVYIYTVTSNGEHNWPGETYAWAVDVVPPKTTLNTKPSKTTTSKSANFTFIGEDNRSEISRFRCKLDDADNYANCEDSITYNNLTVGTHTFYVRSVDGAGNVENPGLSYSWTIKQ